MKRLLWIIVGVICIGALLPTMSDSEILWSIILFPIIIAPQLAMSIIPFLIQWRNKGKRPYLTFLTYILCFLGILQVNYEVYRFGFPRFNDGEDILFFLKILPFLIVLILALNNHRNREYYNYD